MKTRLTVMLALPAVLALSGCSSKNIIEMNTQETSELREIGKYYAAPLEVSFDPPAAWEISNDEWELWVEGWRVDYKSELRAECLKTIEFVDSAEDAEGAVVTIDVYEMDNGGFAGFGGNGFARAHVRVVDGDRVLYDAKLEGTGANSGFESAVTRGRMKFAILNLARQICEVLEDGQ